MNEFLETKIHIIGLSRTGTTSLTEALKEIGYNIIHYPSRNQLYDPVYDGVSDIPAANFYSELDRIYPNSVFIYTQRDRDSWIDSVERHVTRKRPGSKFSSWQQENRIRLYGCLDFEKDKYLAAYDRHENEVRTYFKNKPAKIFYINIVNGKDKENQLLALEKFIKTDKKIKLLHLNKRK